MTMRTVIATRYVTPLREGGSLPGLVEADDDGLYVVKFRGAGQGPRALVAEWLAGELARAIGLAVPDLVAVDLDPTLGDAEPDEEVHDLLGASGGLNLGHGLPARRADLQSGRQHGARGHRSGRRGGRRLAGRAGHEPGPDRRTTRTCSSGTAGRGSSTTAPRCTSTTPGATRTRTRAARSSGSADHVLLPYAGSIADGGRAERRRGSIAASLDGLVAAIPDLWLPDDPVIGDAAAQRRAYVRYLLAAARGAAALREEADRVHAAA